MASIGSTQIPCLNLDLKLPSIGRVAQINRFCEPVSTVNHQRSIFFKRPNSLILCGKLSYIQPRMHKLCIWGIVCVVKNVLLTMFYLLYHVIIFQMLCVLFVISCYNFSNVIYLYRCIKKKDPFNKLAT